MHDASKPTVVVISFKALCVEGSIHMMTLLALLGSLCSVILSLRNGVCYVKSASWDI